METYKVKDLYIVRPLKLIKSKKYRKFQIPIYNIFDRMGLMFKIGPLINIERANAKINKSFRNILRTMIDYKTPKNLYKSALVCEKSTYLFEADKVAIARLNSRTKQYCNVVTGEHYNLYGVNLCERCGTDLIIRERVLAKTSLVSFLMNENLDLDYASQDTLCETLSEKELTLDELREIRDRIVSHEIDKEITIECERTPLIYTYVSSPFYNRTFAYDIDGNEISPTCRARKTLKKIRN